MAEDIRLDVNGKSVSVAPRPDETLLDTLRQRVQDKSVRGACGIGVCGTCTVLIEGRSTSSCLTFTSTQDGAAITTPSAPAAAGSTLEIVREAFVGRGAYQCSFCIPAMVLSVAASIDRHAAGADGVEPAAVLADLDGNICRCGSYPSILRAITLATDEFNRRSADRQ